MSHSREAARVAMICANHGVGPSELTYAVREFTALVRRRRRENLTDVEIAKLRSLLRELTSHLHGLTPQP